MTHAWLSSDLLFICFSRLSAHTSAYARSASIAMRPAPPLARAAASRAANAAAARDSDPSAIVAARDAIRRATFVRSVTRSV